MKISIVIPVYNEEQTVTQLVEKIINVKLKHKIKKEIIIVDDGSSDRSGELIHRLAKKHPEIKKTFISIINLGKGAAIRFGLKYATGDVILIQDADLELDPNEYNKLLDPIVSQQTSVVYGSRFKSGENIISFKTIWANRLLTGITNLLFAGNLSDMETAYKVFRSEAIKKLNLRCVGFDIEPEITAKLLMAGYSIYEVPITYQPRRENEGKKISFYDGLDALSTLIKIKLFPRS